MGCWCRDLALPRRGADAAFCELAGAKTEIWTCVWVALVKLASISFFLSVLTLQVALGIELCPEFWQKPVLECGTPFPLTSGSRVPQQRPMSMH